jgi:ADP-heptose:LPS heptosyltransferase
MRVAFGHGDAESSSQALPVRGIHRILVCHVSHTLGNTLLLTPLLRELERLYPGAEVDVVTRSPVADGIFGAFDGVRHVYRLPRHGVASPFSLLRTLRELRARRYDLAIDPCLRSQSDRIGVLLANAQRTLGFVGPGKSGVLTHDVESPDSIVHIGKLPVYLLRRAVGRLDSTPYPRLDICLTDEEREHGSSQLMRLFDDAPSTIPGMRPTIIGLFANATGAKNLGCDWWQSFAARVATRWPNARIVEFVPAAGDSLLDAAYPTFYSSDLRRLASVMANVDLFVSADCGVMHLACAAGTRTVGLFSVTDPAEWGPYGPGNHVFEIAGRTPEQIADSLPPPH